MTTTTMTVISTTMTTTGATMTAASSVSGLLCKLCIRSALNINENHIDTIKDAPLFCPVFQFTTFVAC